MASEATRTPESVTITVVHDDTGQPIPGIAILPIALVSIKNDYSVGPFVTDVDGCVVLTKGDIVDAIEEAIYVFPNDYCAGVDDIHGFKVRALDRNRVESLLRLRKTWGEINPKFVLSDELRLALEASRNGEYQAKTVHIDGAEFEEHLHIAVRLSPIA